MTSSVVTLAQGLSAATTYEAAGRRGALPSSIRPAAAHFRVCGLALPVLCPPGDNLWLHRAIAVAHPAEVLVVDASAHGEAGHWGEVMSHAARFRGLAGLVIHGGVRDSSALATVGFPVFASAVCLCGTTKDPTRFGAIGEPIIIETTTIRHGDLVVGDADGVVVVPAAMARAVVDSAHRREREEAAAIARLRKGETTLDIYGLPG